MSLKNVGKYINDRLSLIVGIGIIVSIHWGWYKLQQVPSFVNESERKELPIILFAQYLKREATGSVSPLPKPSSLEKVQHETDKVNKT